MTSMPESDASAYLKGWAESPSLVPAQLMAAADTDGDGETNVTDLLNLLAAYGVSARARSGALHCTLHSFTVIRVRAVSPL